MKTFLKYRRLSITLIPKPDKDPIKKELQANILDEHRCENSHQNTGQ